MRAKKLSLIAGMTAILTMITPFMPVAESFADEPDSKDLIFSSDFEDKNILDWAVFGGTGTLTLDTENKQSGNASLNISDRQQSFNSPSVIMDSYFSENESYRITGWVYHEASTAQTLQCTIRYTDSVDVPVYRAVASIEAKPKTWTYFEGITEVPEDTVSSFIYIETENTDLSYNIDDIRIYGKTPEKENNSTVSVEQYQTSFSFGFEKGFEDWAGRGDMRLIRTSDVSHSGDYSVIAANRTKAWNGPTVNIDSIQREKEYNYSSYVMYNDPECAGSHIFRLQLQYNLNGSEVYELITDGEVVKGKWSELAGTFTIPKEAQNVNLYIQTDNPEEGAEPAYDDLMSFYVDDISVIRSDLAGGNKILIYTIIAAVIGTAALIFILLMIKRSFIRKDDEQDADLQDLAKKLNENDLPEMKPAILNNDTSDVPPADNTEDKKPENSKSPSDKKAENKQASQGTKENNPKKSKNKSGSKKKNGKENENKINRIFEVETFSYDENSSSHTDDPLDTKNADGATLQKNENTNIDTVEPNEHIKAENTDTGIADAKDVDPDNFQV